MRVWRRLRTLRWGLRTTLRLVGVALFVVAVAPVLDNEAGIEPVAGAWAAAMPTQIPTTARTIEPRVLQPASRSYVVTRVIDGDTIALDSGVKVRLVQIDAPEVSEGECYSRKATTTLERLLPTPIRVRLQFDPQLDKLDRYDRRLAYVFKGTELINLTLVRRGAASPYFYRGDRGRYSGKLDAAAREARSAKRGLWATCSATAYDPYRPISTRVGDPAGSPKPPLNGKCHPSYAGACLDPNASDYDCEGGSGNGPKYTGLVRVVGPDVFGLDADGDGYGCE